MGTAPPRNRIVHTDNPIVTKIYISAWIPVTCGFPAGAAAVKVILPALHVVFTCWIKSSDRKRSPNLGYGGRLASMRNYNAPVRFLYCTGPVTKYQNCLQLTPERVTKYQNVPQLTPEGVPKYQNFPQLTPESVLQKTKTSKVNHQKECHKFP